MNRSVKIINRKCIKRTKSITSDDHTHTMITSKELLTTKELMDFLSISKSTVRNYINKGYLKPLGMDRRQWFKKSEVLETLEQGR
tara:strand:+ start:154 stop:408 length:255 start_codon:yes stop_codon:yes gene_type:complete